MGRRMLRDGLDFKADSFVFSSLRSRVYLSDSDVADEFLPQVSIKKE